MDRNFWRERPVRSVNTGSESAPDTYGQLCASKCAVQVDGLELTLRETNACFREALSGIAARLLDAEIADTSIQAAGMGLAELGAQEAINDYATTRFGQAISQSMNDTGLDAERIIMCRGRIPLLGCTASIKPYDG